MIGRMNKKGLVDTLMPWIITFLILIFFMAAFAIAVFVIFVGNDIPKDADFKFKESNIDIVSNSKFLDFLDSKIIVNGREEKVIDVIKSSSNQDEEKLVKIMESLRDRCFSVEGTLFLDIPQGIITINGLMAKPNREPSISLSGAGGPFYYYDPIIHKTNYLGENIEIHAGIFYGKTKNNFKLNLWGLCQ